MAFSLVLPTTIAKAETKSVVGVSTVYEEKRGKEVNISVYINGSEEVAGGSLTLFYDKTALTVEDEPIIGEELSDYLTSVNTEKPGKVMFEWAKATEQILDGTLLTVTLELEKSSETINLDLQEVKLFNEDFEPISVDVFDGQVKPFKGDMRKYGTKVKGSKEWNVRFNKEFNKSTVNKHTVFVRDSRGNVIDVAINLSGKNIIVVKPKGVYEYGTYTLEITEQVRDLNGKQLKEPVKFEFSVE